MRIPCVSWLTLISISSSSARAPVATSPQSAPRSSASRWPSSRRNTGAAYASTWAVSPPRRCSATPSSHTPSCATVRPSAFRRRLVRLRCGVRPQPQGVGRHRQGRPLPHEEEQDHRDRRLRHVRRREDRRGRGHQVHVRRLHHRHRFGGQDPAGDRAEPERGQLRGADPLPRAAEVDRHRRRRRDRHGVRLHHVELRRGCDDRRVHGPRPAERGPRGLQGDGQALQEARREAPDRSQDHQGHRQR